MENWQQDWFKAFETIAAEVGQLFEAVGRDLAEATDALLDLSEEVADDVEDTLNQIDEVLAPKLEQLDEQIGQWLDPVVQAIWGIEATIDRAVEPVTHTVEPWLNQHPACIGCRNYHGQQYGGNFLVCAMHPYGVEEGVECPDKELINWSFPASGDPQDHNNF
ncbi:MAG: hypothetical protein EDM05_67825 [Leptolyngbya sp. IPPAS B-1204]|uniref:Uncharacterized protein n=1 Tax=Leptolyngbya sp. NK1-12 TaxID=2547451 RepID=A0AA96WUR9_9CYAN|nr:hypothetical protein [Leptolyngbya sp. NK1-12]MBF2048938.1 hypothetical protein [Elainella sp. C42_A2020_010]RNJ66345.1 MAG: hypothetical protein EDM05_26450 [Leptolyngbya sp. IPPAS B-1204]WNZ23667.1 hypothetical protein HJG54_12920 [Leptolyngbya sp. NK1-12]